MDERWKSGWRRLWSGLSRRWLAAAVGIAGILLIGLSEWSPHGAAPRKPAGREDTAAAEQALEARLTALLGSMDGVGSCRVMVTLESGTRAVYAVDSTHSKEDDSRKVVVGSGRDGPAGLVETRLCPAIRGVAVVCAGGNNPAVCSRVRDTVAAALHISTRRVAVMPKET